MSVLLQKLLHDRDVVLLLYQKWSLCSCGETFEEYADAENHLVLKHQRHKTNNASVNQKTATSKNGTQNTNYHDSQQTADTDQPVVNNSSVGIK